MLQLIPASLNDISIIYKLAVKIWNHHYIPIIGKAQVEYMLSNMYSTKDLTHQMTVRDHRFFLIEIHGQIYGFLSVSGKEDMFIHKFYIDQEIQGKGYGEAAFLELLKHYPFVKTFSLTVNRNNYKSINFYFKIGFKIDHIDDFDIGQGYFMNDFIMKWIKQ